MSDVDRDQVKDLRDHFAWWLLILWSEHGWQNDELERGYIVRRCELDPSSDPERLREEWLALVGRVRAERACEGDHGSLYEDDDAVSLIILWESHSIDEDELHLDFIERLAELGDPANTENLHEEWLRVVERAHQWNRESPGLQGRPPSPPWPRTSFFSK